METARVSALAFFVVVMSQSPGLPETLARRLQSQNVPFGTSGAWIFYPVFIWATQAVLKMIQLILQGRCRKIQGDGERKALLPAGESGERVCALHGSCLCSRIRLHAERNRCL